jgi:acyl-[acyl-carrier-protein]-phospholipid O-acyltransferase/long-chain-fatty-acid--[acyl-carrier-protein] ligase
MPVGVEAVVAHAAAALCGRTVVPSDGDEAITSLHALDSRSRFARAADCVEDGLHPAAAFTKRVLLSHASLASNAQALAQMFRIGPGEAVLGVLPFSSVLGSVATMWVPLLSGACIVACANPRDPKSLEEACARGRPTVVVATPSLYREWLEGCAPGTFASVRLFVCGGEPLDRDLANAWQERFGAELCEGYGCSELAAVVSVNLPGIESQDARQNASKPGTVGRAIPGVAVRVVDPETFAPLPPEHEGLLLARGPGRMIGYEGDPDRTARAFRDGWFVTGDRAMIDKDAFVVLS